MIALTGCYSRRKQDVIQGEKQDRRYPVHSAASRGHVWYGDNLPAILFIHSNYYAALL